MTSRKKPHPLPNKREYNKGEENPSLYIFQSRLLSVISNLSCYFHLVFQRQKNLI